MGSHRHLRFPSMSFIYKCSFRKPEWCFCFSRFGEESFFASTVTRLKPALSVFSIAIELKLIIACKGTDNKLVSQDGFHRTLTYQQNHSKFATSGRMPMRPMANRQSSGQYPSQNTMNGVINGKMQKKVEAIITIASQHKIIGIS